MHHAAQDWRGLAKTSWILIALACLLSVIPVLGFASWFIAGPIFVATFVMAIMIMSRGGTGQGLILLGASMFAAPAFVICAPFVSSLLGLAGVGAALEHHDRVTNRTRAPITAGSPAFQSPAKAHQGLAQPPEPAESESGTATRMRKLPSPPRSVPSVQLPRAEPVPGRQPVNPSGKQTGKIPAIPAGKYAGKSVQQNLSDQFNPNVTVFLGTSTVSFDIGENGFSCTRRYEVRPTEFGTARGENLRAWSVRWEGTISANSDGSYALIPRTVRLVEKSPPTLTDSATSLPGDQKRLSLMKWTVTPRGDRLVEKDGEVWNLVR